MNLKDFKDLVNSISTKYDDCEVYMQDYTWPWPIEGHFEFTESEEIVLDKDSNKQVVIIPKVLIS